MNIKPFPWSGYHAFKHRMHTPFFQKRTGIIRSRLLRRGYITPGQAADMVATSLYSRFGESL
ncbi:MAG: hypothetical protein QF464_23440 [Myxococcota bacterium]|nr:hypothetical protein [Myxococcota bacterium]